MEIGHGLVDWLDAGWCRRPRSCSYGVVSAPEYWLGRLVLERGVAAIYLIAFIAAVRQFRPLIGEHGMLPVPAYLTGRSFWRTPSIFHFRYSDRLFAAVSWFGAALSAAMVAGLADLAPLWAAMAMWLTLWVLYLSIVNVGQTWYGFGWSRCCSNRDS